MIPNDDGVVTFDQDVNDVGSVKFEFTPNGDEPFTVGDLTVEACIEPAGMAIIQQDVNILQCRQKNSFCYCTMF